MEGLDGAAAAAEEEEAREIAYLVRHNMRAQFVIRDAEATFMGLILSESVVRVTMETQEPYVRMLLHRVADLFELEHESEGMGADRHLVVSKTLHSHIPCALVSDVLFPPELGGEAIPTPVLHVLQRDSSEAGGPSDHLLPPLQVERQALEDRKAAYEAARARIFSAKDDSPAVRDSLGLDPTVSMTPRPRAVPLVARRMIAHALNMPTPRRPPAGSPTRLEDVNAAAGSTGETHLQESHRSLDPERGLQQPAGTGDSRGGDVGRRDVGESDVGPSYVGPSDFGLGDVRESDLGSNLGDVSRSFLIPERPVDPGRGDEGQGVRGGSLPEGSLKGKKSERAGAGGRLAGEDPVPRAARAARRMFASALGLTPGARVAASRGPGRADLGRPGRGRNLARKEERREEEELEGEERGSLVSGGSTGGELAMGAVSGEREEGKSGCSEMEVPGCKGEEKALLALSAGAPGEETFSQGETKLAEGRLAPRIVGESAMAEMAEGGCGGAPEERKEESSPEKQMRTTEESKRRATRAARKMFTSALGFAPAPPSRRKTAGQLSRLETSMEEALVAPAGNPSSEPRATTARMESDDRAVSGTTSGAVEESDGAAGVPAGASGGEGLPGLPAGTQVDRGLGDGEASAMAVDRETEFLKRRHGKAHKGVLSKNHAVQHSLADSETQHGLVNEAASIGIAPSDARERRESGPVMESADSVSASLPSGASQEVVESMTESLRTHGRPSLALGQTRAILVKALGHGASGQREGKRESSEWTRTKLRRDSSDAEKEGALNQEVLKHSEDQLDHRPNPRADIVARNVDEKNLSNSHCIALAGQSLVSNVDHHDSETGETFLFARDQNSL